MRMKKNTICSFFLLFAGLVHGTGAAAFDLRLNAFGTLAVGKSISSAGLPGGSDSTYLVVPTLANDEDGRANPDSAYNDDWAWKPDSNAALQLTALVTPTFTATVQLTAQGANGLQPEIEWANIAYELTDRFTVKLGRQRIPLYFYSDYLDLGYAYHWLRPPVDVYGEGVSTYTGASATYKGSLYGWGSRLDAYYGDVANDTAFSWKARDEGLFGVVLTFERDWLTLRASYHFTDKAYTDVGGIQSLPAKTITKENPADGYFASLGFMADFDRWFFGGEVTLQEAKPAYEAVAFANGLPLLTRGSDRQSFMLTGGYRLSDITVHASYSGRSTGLAIPAIGLSDIRNVNRRTWSLGMRWDFAEDWALKAELTHAVDRSEQMVKALLGNAQENTVFALGLDFVF